MAVFTFAGQEIKYIVESIKIKKDKNYNTQTFIGTSPSNKLEYISTDGKIVSFTSIIIDTEVLQKYRKLNDTYTKKSGVLVGASDLGINGNYYLTKYEEEKLINGSYKIEWEFTEYIRPNVVQKTFKQFGKKPKAKKTKTTKKKTAKYITELLTKCKTMKKGSHGKCVKKLQKFLQKKGFYSKCKIDGKYESETKKAVAKLQKKYKIKKCKSGEWDKITRKYFRTKYKIK